MPFSFEALEIPEVILVTAKQFLDDRGFFLEAYKQSEFGVGGINTPFVQENLSYSKKGVLRALHYQLPPKDQGKLVRVLKGRIFDVAVDIRKSSPTFKKWVGQELSGENNLAMYIPVGFAHGFLALSDEALVAYNITAEFAPSLERGIVWNDPELNINWPNKQPILSEKDRNFPLLSGAEIFN